MKHLFSFISAILLATTVSAQGIYVYKKTGEVVRMLNSEMDSIVTFASDFNGHEAVDLGLSVKWASTNLGSEQPEAAGGYYAWGETVAKDEYTTFNYTWADLNFPNLVTRGVINKVGNLCERHDAARQEWGGSWRIPTADEMLELRRDCKWTWTAVNGKQGYQVEGPNGNTIFLPAAGFNREDKQVGAGEVGYYWTSSAYHDYSSSESLYFYNVQVDWYNDNRYIGLPIRPVVD